MPPVTELALAGRRLALHPRLTVVVWGDQADAVRRLEAPGGDGSSVLEGLDAAAEARSDLAIVEDALARLRSSRAVGPADIAAAEEALVEARAEQDAALHQLEALGRERRRPSCLIQTA